MCGNYTKIGNNKKKIYHIPTTMAATSSTSNAAYEPWSESHLKEVIRLWELSSRDEQRLRDFQQRVRDIDHEWNDPHVLLRYMFASQGCKHAERLFREMIQWRLEHRVDRILQEHTPNPLLLDYTPIAFLKEYDKDGDPIYVERGGAIDAQGMLHRFSKDELDKHAIWLREMQSSGPWVEEYERRQGRAIRDITVVYDLKGLNSRHLNPQVLSWFQAHMHMTDAYYAGPVKRVIIIRAPAIFCAIWSIVKHFFPQTARDKMIFAGHSNHLEVLSKYMDLDALPTCIYPQGTGETAEGMPKRMEGGRIPEYVGYGGEGYVPARKYCNTDFHSFDAKKYARTQSDKTPSTCSEESSDEGLLTEEEGCRNKAIKEWIPKGHWEEVQNGRLDQVHVLWEASTGVEIADKGLLLTEKNLVFF